MSGTKSVSKLLVEGIDVREDPVLDEGVMVAALSQEINLPLLLGWSLQDVPGARLLYEC